MTNFKLQTINRERPRLVVRKSLKGLQIQVISSDGRIVAGIYTLKNALNQAVEKVAKEAMKKAVKKVRFDRGKHPYHGIVARAASAARAAGLEF